MMKQKPEKSPRPITVDEVQKYLSTTMSAVEELHRALASLPPVNSDGYSACHFAEELYAKKEEAHEKVEESFKKMDAYRSWVDNEISHCQDNLTVISAHEDRLHHDSPRDRFSEAEVKLSALYKRLIRLRQKIRELITQIQEVLRESSQRKFPGKIPQPNNVPPASSVTDQEGSTTAAPRVVDQYLAEVMAMGPVSSRN